MLYIKEIQLRKRRNRTTVNASDTRKGLYGEFAQDSDDLGSTRIFRINLLFVYIEAVGSLNLSTYRRRASLPN